MSDRRRFCRCLVAAWLIAPSFPVWPADDDTARLVVERADQIRNPRQPFEVTLHVTEYRNGHVHGSATLQLYSKLQPATRRYRNLARFVEPTADVGKILLMDEEDLWFYDPASSASIRISPQQRLVGQVANGDVMTANFGRDYESHLVSQERVKDADGKERSTWRLKLTAASDSAVYRRIDYWVERDTYLPVKARFYVDSGRALKLAFYRKYSVQLGQPRAGEMIVLDEVDRSVITKMTFSRYDARNIPDSWFNRDYLPRLRVSDAGSEQ